MFNKNLFNMYILNQHIEPNFQISSLSAALPCKSITPNTGTINADIANKKHNIIIIGDYLFIFLIIKFRLRSPQVDPITHHKPIHNEYWTSITPATKKRAHDATLE